MKLINADCIAAMKAMPDNSVDSIVTDPPYELGFMGKSWDASGIAFNVDVWREALRVMKPGGHLIAFSGSRTYHRMAVAIEDAGFQIRDQIMWVYGSGFPKSHNISKAIQKADGVEPVGFKENENAAFYGTGSGGQYNPTPRQLFMPPTEGVAAEWNGWGTALKPAHEPMVLARKPLEGTVANNVLTYGVGGLNIDGSRVGSEGGTSLEGVEPTPRSGNENVYGVYKNMSFGKPVEGLGRFPANFIHDGSDEVVALFPNTKAGIAKRGNSGGNNFGSHTPKPPLDDIGYADSGSAARFFYCAKASKRDRNEGLDGFAAKRDHDGRKDGGVGGDNPRNRTNNAKLNHHPTVKPTSLMQYLVRLVTPPNGIVLDPFMGSGSTGKACAYEGFSFIGIDQSAEYVEIARARIDFALADKETELPL
jgi:site-specific DNA-methyltransferase (adenine-specific)